ncbi:MAM and LDL-receptor class A domain-containing protein 1-like [Pectinophora gossypiella]|uniref:MAM and LDL-receptor class A domain-containing protein 1-like n=1 Tax=Pectinophora gossypiella TaxID=13191 RepID=UPI00214F4DF0|nr:MAM and LDL-receptor class A domain-containing protein 1-like [Pectinophora gossypiella]
MFFKKCFLLLFIFSDVLAQYGMSSRPCPFPNFTHGRYRIRQKSKLIKFVCFIGYELVGNKYATCRDGEWDVPTPVCVKPGCQLPKIANGVVMTSHKDAWAMVFCLPQHKLLGSPAIYCDGKKWNATAPTCVDATNPSALSCDFEDPNLCGWSQDELHDFDWKRLSKKTPSSFLFTGPSYDHTFGERGSGYYMYIESTSRLWNDTARLLSPIYDASLAKNGCFSFFYHMFGKTTGGLRIYQKPDQVALAHLMRLPESERRKYLLFEKWGNQGDVWYGGVSMLTDLNDDFQIVIEGIRGSSFTSDIAIDDVSILQGVNCTIAKNMATTPAVVMPDSCSGRCDVFGIPDTELGCGCTASCVADGKCCPDFFDVCVFDSSTTTDENSPAELPQTQKLVAPTVTTTEATVKMTPIPTTKLTTITTPKVIRTTRPFRPTKPIATTKKLPILVFKTTAKMSNKTGIIQKDTTKPTVVTSTAKVTTRVPKTSTTTEGKKKSYIEDTLKAKKEQSIEAKRLRTHTSDEKPSKSSSGLRTSILTITGLLCCAGAIWGVMWGRGARGREAIARLRGRTRHDADVRYLHADVDE